MDNRIKSFFIVAVAVTCWASCKKKGDAPTKSVGTSLVNVLNLSNNNINFYINGNRINNTTTFYPGGTLGYMNVISGTQNYSFKVDGSGANSPFYNKPFKADSAAGYTFYVAGQTENDVFSTHDTWFPDTGANLTKYAQIRFVNASSVAGNVKFVLVGKNSTIADSVQFDNVPYKTITDFTRITKGIHYIGIYRSAYPQTPKIDTVTISAGKIYTFYGYGTSIPAGNLGIIAGLFNNG
ncbi:DUF4397 domain-containing protein [Mucilaginibacter dorajii]|uniref:DUF4397 domain-containing protein n=1 Tax=Mucilaginibacter dorajii TaxID=692994 RepID=A0ABP7PHQ2_9SPHI|nr:DUF4397 domain-containing protein [Mucilaginibacter dorajii]MCS3733375.1 hypothetical protein [Mucilaginibacter dorajii]